MIQKEKNNKIEEKKRFDQIQADKKQISPTYLAQKIMPNIGISSEILYFSIKSTFCMHPILEWCENRVKNLNHDEKQTWKDLNHCHYLPIF